MSQSDSSPAFHVRESGKQKSFLQDQPKSEWDHCPSSRGVHAPPSQTDTLTTPGSSALGPRRVRLPGQLSHSNRHAMGFCVSGQQRLKGLKQGLCLPMADGGTNSYSSEDQASHKCGQDSAASIPSQPSQSCFLPLHSDNTPTVINYLI